jgi:hypothetical protein
MGSSRPKLIPALPENRAAVLDLGRHYTLQSLLDLELEKSCTCIASLSTIESQTKTHGQRKKSQTNIKQQKRWL